MRLNLGCGAWLRKDFVNVDVYPEEEIRSKKGIWKNVKIEWNSTYIQADIRDLPFPDESAEYVEMMDVIEHIPFREVIPVFQEVARVMEPEAKLVLTTPNFDALMLDWLNMIRGVQPNFAAYYELTQGIYGNQHTFTEYHRTPFNPVILDATLTAAGLKGVIYSLPRGTLAPQVGTVKHKKKLKMRYEMLVAEVTKEGDMSKIAM